VRVSAQSISFGTGSSDDAHGYGGVCPLGARHWGIENKLHWVPDVVFREDYARNRKFSLNRKRLYASYEPDFLLKILLDL
jgi:hypothetical protein